MTDVNHRPTNLSQSSLWTLQTEYFDKFGIDAFRDVPTDATNNPFLGHCCAELVCAYARDLLAQGALNTAAPMHIVELGSGTGRFAWHFVRAFAEELDRRNLSHLKWRYVLTDIGEKNLEFWQNQAVFKPFFESGHLDYARFQLGKSTSLSLRRSGEEICSTNVLTNPMVLLANYLFDSIPHDFFRCTAGTLEVARVTIQTTAEPKVPTEMHTTWEPLPGAYFDQAHRQAVLDACQKHIPKGAFLVPVGAFDAVDQFRALCADRLLLVATDKGVDDPSYWQSATDTGVVGHGSVSFLVNFWALHVYFELLSGATYRPEGRTINLQTHAFMLGAKPAAEHFKAAAHRSIAHLNGGDILPFYMAKETWPPMHAGAIVALLRFSQWDPALFWRSLEALNASLRGQSNHHLLPSLRQMGAALISRCYTAEERTNLAFDLGLVMLNAGAYDEAITLTQATHLRESYSGQLNLGLCYFCTENFAQAAVHFKAALSWRPNDTQAIKWLEECAVPGGLPALE